MLAVENLSRRYDEKKVLDNINLSFPPGSFSIIAGPNGSGKTLLMRHLNGLLKPQEGQVLLDGMDIQQDLKAARRKVGLVFQNADSQMVGQTVASDMAFGPENLGWPRSEVQEAVENILRGLSLYELKDRPPHSLSGGEKRRCVLGAVLVMQPQIIVLDEPFTGLDFPGVQLVLKDITELHRQGKTVILISHDLEKCLAHADRLILMEQGRVCADDEPERLLSRLKDFHIYRPWGEHRPLETMTWLRS